MPKSVRAPTERAPQHSQKDVDAWVEAHVLQRLREQIGAGPVRPHAIACARGISLWVREDGRPGWGSFGHPDHPSVMLRGFRRRTRGYTWAFVAAWASLEITLLDSDVRRATTERVHRIAASILGYEVDLASA